MFSSLMVLKMTTVMKRCPTKVDVVSMSVMMAVITMMLMILIVMLASILKLLSTRHAHNGGMTFKMEVKVKKV